MSSSNRNTRPRVVCLVHSRGRVSVLRWQAVRRLAAWFLGLVAFGYFYGYGLAQIWIWIR